MNNLNFLQSYNIRSFKIKKEIKDICEELEKIIRKDVRILNINRLIPNYFLTLLCIKRLNILLYTPLRILILKFLDLPAEYFLNKGLSFIIFDGNGVDKRIEQNLLKKGAYRLIPIIPFNEKKFDEIYNCSFPLKKSLILNLKDLDPPEEIIKYKLLEKVYQIDKPSIEDVIFIYSKSSFLLKNDEIFDFICKCSEDGINGSIILDFLYKKRVISKEYYFIFGLNSTSEGSELFSEIIENFCEKELSYYNYCLKIIEKKLKGKENEAFELAFSKLSLVEF